MRVRETLVMGGSVAMNGENPEQWHHGGVVRAAI